MNASCEYCHYEEWRRRESEGEAIWHVEIRKLLSLLSSTKLDLVKIDPHKPTVSGPWFKLALKDKGQEEKIIP